MLKIYNISELSKQEIDILIKRNTDEDNSINASVSDIINEVKTRKDAALLDLTERFDKVKLESIFLDASSLEELAKSVSSKQKEAINLAYQNIKKFHETQILQEDKTETMPGVTCWREARAIEKAGIYIPGGSAVLPSTFLMLAVPAQIAGCDEIVVCTPPDKSGKVNPFIAYVATLLKIEKVYLCGGAQAIAAMAWGTETVPRVDKIFGPGNQFVTKAKTIVQSTTQVSIDMPAGPSEVLVIADEQSEPDFVAADLLAQLEHGIDSQAILVSTSHETIDKVSHELLKQLPLLERSDIAKKALATSYAVKVNTLADAINFSNKYAPEHLILSTEKWSEIVPEIKNAGSVFLGNLTPESAGDYASGTNHTLPTSAYARSYSGVSVDSFIKKITFQHITESGLKNLGPAVEILAELEGLQAHKNSVSIRLKKLKNEL